jgi:hypothetical protein
LGNGGEQITLMAGDELIHQFAYSDRWYPTTDGTGYTLEMVDVATADLASWARQASWRSSVQLGGSPGTIADVPLAGDANHDGVFNSSDLTLVLQAGEYEDNLPGNSTFEEGDWNGDGDFTSADLILAIQAGTYVAAVKSADLFPAEALRALRRR